MTFGGRFLFIFSTSCNVLPVPVTILEFYHISFLTWDTLVLRFFRELYFTIKLIKVGSKTRSVPIIAYFLSYKFLYKWVTPHETLKIVKLGQMVKIPFNIFSRWEIFIVFYCKIKLGKVYFNFFGHNCFFADNSFWRDGDLPFSIINTTLMFYTDQNRINSGFSPRFPISAIFFNYQIENRFNHPWAFIRMGIRLFK